MFMLMCHRRQVPAKRLAFTLIEILVVVAIIALLVAILLPSLLNAKEVSKRSVCATHQHQIMLSLAMYTQDHKGALPHYLDSTDPTQTNILNSYLVSRWFWVGALPTDTNCEANLMHMWPKYLRDGQLLYCPSAKSPFFQYSTYAPFPKKTDKGGTIGTYIRAGYNYNPWIKLNVDQATYPDLYRFMLKYPKQQQYERLYTSVNDKKANSKIMLTDMFSQIYDDDLFYHKTGPGSFGFNVALGDGSVLFRRNSDFLKYRDVTYDRYLENLRLLNKGI